MASYIDKWDTICRLQKMAVDCELFGKKKKARFIREVIRFPREDVAEYVSDKPLERRKYSCE